MIHYSNKGFCATCAILFRFYGSIWPTIIIPSLLAGGIAFALTWFGAFPQDTTASLMEHPNTFNYFFQLAAFILAFHTNQAYQRYWEARTQLQAMGAYWTDSASQLMAYNLYEKLTENSEDRMIAAHFRARMLQYFSLMHALCINYLLHSSKRRPLAVIGGVPDWQWKRLESCKDQPFQVCHWILRDIGRRNAFEGFDVPPPILSRTYQGVSWGVVAFSQACKIEDTPFPFPYVQLLNLIDVLLIFVTPVVVACWTPDPYFSATLAILAVACWHATFKAAEMMESPFGHAYNDLPLVELHDDFVDKLSILVDSEVATCLMERLNEDSPEDDDERLFTAAMPDITGLLGPSISGAAPLIVPTTLDIPPVAARKLETRDEFSKAVPVVNDLNMEASRLSLDREGTTKNRALSTKIKS